MGVITPRRSAEGSYTRSFTGVRLASLPGDMTDDVDVDLRRELEAVEEVDNSYVELEARL